MGDGGLACHSGDCHQHPNRHHHRPPSHARRDPAATSSRQARRSLAQGANKTVLGPRELELSGNELLSRTAFVESRMRLEVVERVVSDGAHTFIYLGTMLAIVIPHDAVSEGDPEAFAEAAQAADRHKFDVKPQQGANEPG